MDYVVVCEISVFFGLSDVSPAVLVTNQILWESTYYNLLAPVSYGGLNKFKPKGYTKKQVREWLQSQDTHTLHKPTRRI
jgi:hypothetical protein